MQASTTWKGWHSRSSLTLAIHNCRSNYSRPVMTPCDVPIRAETGRFEFGRYKGRNKGLNRDGLNSSDVDKRAGFAVGLMREQESEGVP